MRQKQFKILCKNFINIFTSDTGCRYWMIEEFKMSICDMLNVCINPYHLTNIEKVYLTYLSTDKTGLPYNILIDNGAFRKHEIVRISNMHTPCSDVLYNDFLGITLDGKVIKDKGFKSGAKNYIDINDDDLQLMIDFVVNNRDSLHKINVSNSFCTDNDIDYILFNNTFDDKTDKDNLDYFVDDEGCEWFGVPVTIDIDFDFIIYIPSYSKDSHKLWTKKGKYRDGILKINIRNGSPLIMIKYSERGKICKPKLIKSSFNKSDDTSSLNDIINLIDNNIEDIIIALYNTSINANTDESGSLENCKLEISNYSIDPRDYPRPKTVNEVIDDYIKRSERYEY